METEHRDLRLYRIRIEGSVLPLQQRDFITSVVVQSTEGETESALVLVTPEQAEKLPEFLRIQDIEPALDGIYVGHVGTWYAVKNGEVAQHGRWMIPTDLLASFQEVGSPRQMAATVPSVGPFDPVCGASIRPGLEEASVTYQGQTYTFCSVGCRDLFLANPRYYVESSAGVGQTSNG